MPLALAGEIGASETPAPVSALTTAFFSVTLVLPPLRGTAADAVGASTTETISAAWDQQAEASSDPRG